MYQVYDGDMLMFTVETKYEADEARDQGFTVKRVAKK